MTEQTYPFTEEGISDALTALGTTPNAVATNLSAMGFRGCKDQESNCPVAHYLLASVPDMASVSVFNAALGDRLDESATGHVEGYDMDLGRPPLIVDLPAAVVGFVFAFDKGGFPDLDMEASNGS